MPKNSSRTNGGKKSSDSKKMDGSSKPTNGGIKSSDSKKVNSTSKPTSDGIKSSGSLKVLSERAKSNNWNTLPRPKLRYGHTHPQGYIEPGNRAYLSYYPLQGVWRPTKAIGPIGASFSSPGPAIVNLPPTLGEKKHDYRKFKAPGYKIGEKETPLYHYFGPGPAKYDTTKLTNKGIDVCHAPKVGIKITDLPGFMSPGPAAYGRGDSDVMAYPHAPAYTMRLKTLINKPLIGPAPNAYTLPDSVHKGMTTYGGGPSYSVRIRDRIENPLLGPGPAVYDVVSTNLIKEKPPAYTMGYRLWSKRKGPESPGPASNEMHLVKYHKYSTPRFTFGIRHCSVEAFQKFAAGD